MHGTALHRQLDPALPMRIQIGIVAKNGQMGPLLLILVGRRDRQGYEGGRRARRRGERRSGGEGGRIRGHRKSRIAELLPPGRCRTSVQCSRPQVPLPTAPGTATPMPQLDRQARRSSLVHANQWLLQTCAAKPSLGFTSVRASNRGGRMCAPDHPLHGSRRSKPACKLGDMSSQVSRGRSRDTTCSGIQ